MSAYPSQRDIARILSAAKAAGVEVGGYECLADGTIRVFAPQTVKQVTDDAKDAWEKWQAGDAARRASGQR